MAPVIAPPPAEAAGPKASEAKTFSDAEILASVKLRNARRRMRKSKLRLLREGRAPVAASKKRESPSAQRRADQTRLQINVGEEMGVVPIDIVNAIAGETGLPGKVVGTVDVRERHSFVDVSRNTPTASSPN